MRLLTFLFLLTLLNACGEKFSIKGEWKMTSMCITGEDCMNFNKDDLPFVLNFKKDNEFTSGNSQEVWEKGEWRVSGEYLTISALKKLKNSPSHSMIDQIDKIDFTYAFEMDITDDGLIIMWNSSGTFILKRIN